MAVGVGDVVRADVKAIYDSTQSIQNVFHLRNDGTSQDEANVVDDMVELLEALYALIGGLLNVLYVVQQVRVINVTDSSDVGIGTFVDTTPGTIVGTAAPQLSWGIIFDTVRLASKGRKYFGPATGGQFSQNGVLGATPLSDLADVGDYVIVPQAATNSTWRFGVLSTLEGVGFLPFLSYGVSPTVVTQRRRRIGVGI